MYNKTVLQLGSPIDTAGLVLFGHKTANPIDILVTETGEKIVSELGGSLRTDVSSILPISMTDTYGRLLVTEETELILKS